MDTVISVEWLDTTGIQKIHMNPKYKGGYYRYCLPLPKSGSRQIVIEFGKGFAENAHGFAVSLSGGMSSFLIPHATEVDHLESLCWMLCGMSVAEAAQYEFATEEA